MKKTKLAASLSALALLAGIATQSSAAGNQNFTPIRSSVVVREITGTTEYSYDSTGWKTLTTGKILQAGASVRAKEKSNVVLKTVDATSLIKVCSGTQVHLTLENSAD
jgi:hypothetical protein